jgi:hypothetical protein
MHFLVEGISASNSVMNWEMTELSMAIAFRCFRLGKDSGTELKLHYLDYRGYASVDSLKKVDRSLENFKFFRCNLILG